MRNISLPSTSLWTAMYHAPFQIQRNGIYPVDEELSGPILYAENKEIRHELRNIYGSGGFLFQFLILAKENNSLFREIICDLPIAENPNCVFISQKLGKKSTTQFFQESTFYNYTIWRAETHFLRRHQIRIHAHESGIQIIGETKYNNVPIPSLRDFKRHTKTNRKGPIEPLYSSIAIHLASVRFLLNDEENLINCPLPNKFEAMIKIIQKWN